MCEIIVKGAPYSLTNDPTGSYFFLTIKAIEVLRNLKKNLRRVTEEAEGIEIRAEKTDVFFPFDPFGGEEYKIIIEINRLFPAPHRTETVLKDFLKKIVSLVARVAKEYWPNKSRIEIYLETFDPEQNLCLKANIKR